MNPQILQFIKPHLQKNHLEIEFRLGKKNGNYFDTNVGKENFEKIYRRLSRYPHWESVNFQNTTVFYGSRKGLRVVYDEEKDEQVACVCKYNFGNMDQILENQPLDVRISVSIENPATYDVDKDVFTHERKRQRTSFVRKGLSIDMSIVESSSTGDDKDAENTLSYQVEFEITEPPSGLDDVKIANHYQKVFDVLKLLV
jgi:hypothetical protein